MRSGAARRRLIAALGLLSAAAPGGLALAMTTAAGADAAVKALKPTAIEVAAGKSLFESKCAACHGLHGEGTAIGPSFKSFKRAQSIAGVIEQLTRPLEPATGTKMENFDKLLSTKEKEELGAYVTVELTKTVKVVK